jgi:hypothetical protein
MGTVFADGSPGVLLREEKAHALLHGVIDGLRPELGRKQ